MITSWNTTEKLFPFGWNRTTPKFCGVVIGAVVAGGLAYAGASMQAGATEDAAGQQAQSAANANTTQQEQFNTQQANIKPWLTAGTSAVNTLSAGTQPGGQFSTTPTFNFNPNAIQQDPGYAFRFQQGANALTAAGSAAGNLGSGNMGVALTNYGQQAGSQEYQNAYQRAYQQQMDQYNSQLTSQNTIFNRLSGVAGTGQTANNQLQSAGQNYANQVGNNLMTSATNQGNFGIQGANAISSGIGNVTNQLMGGLQSYNYNNNLQQQGNVNAGLTSSGDLQDPFGTNWGTA